MASLIHLDTHAVVWLAAGELERFAPCVHSLLQQRGCAISPMVRLELDYLHEIGRIKIPGEEIFQDLATRIGLLMDGTPFQTIVAKAAKLTWTRDPFDRLICATALACRKNDFPFAPCGRRNQLLCAAGMAAGEIDEQEPLPGV